jgi:hypothetical protein
VRRSNHPNGFKCHAASIIGNKTTVTAAQGNILFEGRAVKSSKSTFDLVLLTCGLTLAAVAMAVETLTAEAIQSKLKETFTDGEIVRLY